MYRPPNPPQRKDASFYSSVMQAVRLKKLKQSGELTTERIGGILSEAKNPPKSEPAGIMRYRKYFPPDYSQKQIEAVIVTLPEEWKEKTHSLPSKLKKA